MIPGRYDITIYQGGTYRNRLTARSKESGLTTDFTKYTAIRMQIRPPWEHAVGGPRPNAELELSLANGKITMVNANQALDILLTASETAALDFTEGVYDLELVVEAEGLEDEVDKLLYGKVTVIPEVTI